MHGQPVIRKPPMIALRSTSELRDLVEGWECLTEAEALELVRYVAEREIAERHDSHYMRHMSGMIEWGANSYPERDKSNGKLVRTLITD